jgi:proteasome activator subunit 4
MFYNRDPRRIQPIVDYLAKRFQASDFNSELSFDAVKISSFIRAFYEEQGWRSEPWMDDILGRYWSELNNDHDEVSFPLYG